MSGESAWTSIPDLVDTAAEQFGERDAIVDDGTVLSFAGVADASRRAARAFAAAGIERGDRVAVWAPNIHEWIVAAVGLQSVGGVLVPLNTRFKGDEAAYILGRSGAKALLTVGGFLDTDYVDLLRRASPSLPSLTDVVVLRGEASDGTVSWDDFLARGDGRPDRALVPQPDDLSDILFTSGTTGRPKGAMCTHSQTLRAYWAWSDVVGLRDDDRYLIVNPFFHAFGYKAGWVAAMMRGSTILPQAVFDVDAVLHKISEQRATMLPGPPTLYFSILNHPEREKYDLSSLRLAVTGAAVVPVELIRRMRDELGFETIITGYGLTEACGIATMCRHDDDPETIANTSGRAIPGTEVRVVDGDGNEVPRREPGEVVVRGYQVMKGYLDEPEETAAAIDGEGWLHTGDIGVMDDRGYVKITDRKKDMFIVGGFNAYPAEIENLLLGHGAVAQVAVVGVPDDRMGEVGVAYVVPRAGQDVTPDDLLAWSKEHMANYKVPRRVEIVDALPVNAAGKVVKYELRERAAGR